MEQGMVRLARHHFGNDTKIVAEQDGAHRGEDAYQKLRGSVTNISQSEAIARRSWVRRLQKPRTKHYLVDPRFQRHGDGFATTAKGVESILV